MHGSVSTETRDLLSDGHIRLLHLLLDEEINRNVTNAPIAKLNIEKNGEKQEATKLFSMNRVAQKKRRDLSNL